MIALLRHRGPESAGIYEDGPAGLAHARLSIIDLAGGDQPISNEDGTVWVVLNGEIFNYPELRRDLERRGHRFQTASDTEVLVHLYEDYGTDLFEHLNGQFGLALWDEPRQRLLLGRDRLGIRPLFYHHDGHRLLFGSEIKAIFAEPSITRRLDYHSLGDIFTCWSAVAPATPFAGIQQLLPGHWLEFSAAGLTTGSYWQLSFAPGQEPERPLADWADELDDLLTDAARLRLRADVPVGAYLSGGLDSTYISALVKKRFNNRLCTFSVGFADQRFDESSYQRQAVDQLGTDHRAITCTDSEIGDAFPAVVWHAETPMIRTAPVPLYLLAKLVRESGFKVVLTGEGADEMFAGYNIFKEAMVRRFWARNPQSTMRPRLLERLYPYVFSQGDGKARSYLEGFFRRGLDESEKPAFSHLIRWRNTAQLHTFFSTAVRRELDGPEQFVERMTAQLPTDFISWPALSRAQYLEASLFLPGYLLAAQGDRMAMAHAVEGRFPFLDHRVAEFAARVPPRFRLNGLNEKFIVKKAAETVIPAAVLQRHKQPYRAPISGCFFGERQPDYLADLLAPETLQTSNLFDNNRVQRLIGKCRRQGAELVSERENMAVVGIISTLLLEQQFCREFPTTDGRDIELTKKISGTDQGGTS